jgi:rhamnogalacturonan endolyase
LADVKARAARENAAWPYAWHKDDYGFNSRGSISGQLTLSDGRPASGASVFLGDNYQEPNITTLDQGALYYYRVYADKTGAFQIKDVRSGIYALKAWPNGGPIGDVTPVFDLHDVKITTGKTKDLGKLTWKTQNRKLVWQIGTVDRKAAGFMYGGSPRNNAITTKCPGTLKFIVGKSKTNDWCFAQSKAGTWSIEFDIANLPSVGKVAAAPAVLSVAMASYTTAKSTSVRVNGQGVGSLWSPDFLGDAAIARSATLAGEWRYVELPIPAGRLKAGKNVIEIQMGKVNGLNGYLYDSILLEWI